jgi:pimeloyl-ACP methyl ester carboxylesterase
MKKFRALVFVVVAISVVVVCACGHRDESISGIWQGTLKFPGLELRIAFRLSIAPDGTLRANMLRPDENEIEIPASAAVFEYPDLQLEFASVNGSFEGKVKEGVIEGQWKQGRRVQPLILKQVSEIAKPARPQTPAPPYPYNQQEVTFAGGGVNVKLAGTITLPRENHPCPTAILIPGAGAHDRDYTILGHRPFLVISDYLTRRGIAVLRYDERGVGASEGDRSQATSEDYAQDVMAGIDFLRTRKEIDPRLIGLIGHSEGGTIASLAAAKLPDVAYIIMMGSPGLPGEEYNYQYEESMSRALGLSEEAIAAKRVFQERVLDIVLHEEDYSTAEKEIAKIYEEFDPQMPEGRKMIAVKRLLSPWFRFSITHDPGATLMTIRCPVLAIIGEKDVHVPPEGNIEALRRALETGGNKDYRVEELPGLNHFLQTAETGSPVEYGKIKETISPVVLELIGNWILEHTRK